MPPRRNGDPADYQRGACGDLRGWLQRTVALILERALHIGEGHPGLPGKGVPAQVIGDGEPGIGGRAAIADADDIGDGIAAAVGWQHGGLFGGLF